jgi:uncharacterized protein (DUF2236 family)
MSSDRVFPPDSVMWKVVRHRSILLHGPAAVLQIAHPRIGLGVMEHSRFTDSPLGRLERTLDATYAIAFGTRDEAAAAARRVAARHSTVRGDAAAHQVPGPATYSTDELDLLMWVVATLVWSAVGGFDRSVGWLSDDEKDAFYRDMRTLGTFFGLPRDYGPQTYGEYETYFAAVVADESIGSHDVSRRVAHAVARPQTPWWFRLSGRPIGFIFSEILPPPVRDRLGFRSTVFSRVALSLATFGLRVFERIGPDFLRFEPRYRRALAPAHSPAAAIPGYTSPRRA